MTRFLIVMTHVPKWDFCYDSAVATNVNVIISSHSRCIRKNQKTHLYCLCHIQYIYMERNLSEYYSCQLLLLVSGTNCSVWYVTVLECNEMSKEWEHPREPKGWNHMFYHFTVMLSDLKSNPPSIGLAEKPNSAYCTLFYRSGFIGKWQIFAYLFLDIDSFMNYLCSFEASEITSWPFLLLDENEARTKEGFNLQVTYGLRVLSIEHRA